MKKFIYLLLSLVFMSMAFSGCNDIYHEDSIVNSDTITDNETDEISETQPNTSIAETDEWISSPVEDFEYELNENGTITITKYIGTDEIVVIPNKIENRDVTEIGSMCFFEMTNIKHITVSNSVTIIGFSAFKSSSIITVNLSEQTSIIKNAAFMDCINLCNISLPNSLLEIGSSAFENCRSLKQITIPSNVTSWGTDSFANSGLEKLHLSEGLVYIPENSFLGTQIKELQFPSSIKIIKWQAFGNCAKLESIILNYGLITISDSAFAANSNLTQIIIPKTVTTITECSFSACSKLQKVMFDGNAPKTYEKVDTLTGEVWKPSIHVPYTVYYHSDATGFTSPQWFGYATEIW